MKQLIRQIITKIHSLICFRTAKTVGNNCRCNFKCAFTKSTEIGTNCHFNGMRISGSGRVIIGNNFHSGKNIRILTTFHNYRGEALPYASTPKM